MQVHSIWLSWTKSTRRSVQPQAGSHFFILWHSGLHLAPTYLAEDCLAISAIAGKRHLRYTRTGTLSVPRITTTLGMRSFAVAGPVIWNSLPAALRTATLSPLTFARHLKAHLFGWSAARLRTIYDALYKSTHHYLVDAYYFFNDTDGSMLGSTGAIRGRLLTKMCSAPTQLTHQQHAPARVLLFKNMVVGKDDAQHICSKNS